MAIVQDIRFESRDESKLIAMGIKGKISTFDCSSFDSTSKFDMKPDNERRRT